MRSFVQKTLPWLAIAGLFGCAREVRNPGYAPALASNGWVTPAGYAWPPRVVSGTEIGPTKSVQARTAPLAPNQAKSAQPAPKALPPAAVAELFPGGEACLARLAGQGVRFRPSEPKRGVTTPIVIQGPIGGVEFWSHGGGPMITDCRLALALSEVLPELRALGVTRMRFSGAYVYRMARVGRLSLHAHGLALDVHEIVAFGRSFEVHRDFARGLEACDSSSPIVNQVACRLRKRRVFKELLTPDDNADHHDHLHLAIAPEPEPST